MKTASTANDITPAAVRIVVLALALAAGNLIAAVMITTTITNPIKTITPLMEASFPSSDS